MKDMQSGAITPYGKPPAIHRGGALATRTAGLPAPMEPWRPVGDDRNVRSLYSILRRRWRQVLAVTALTLGAGGAYLAMTERSYTASTLVLLDPRSQAGEQKEHANRPAGSDSQGDVTLVESQALVVTSESVLNRTVAALKLADMPEFGGTAEDPALRAAAARDALAGKIDASRADGTYVLRISATSANRELAAPLANAVAAAYTADQTETARAGSRQAREALETRLAEVTENLHRADAKVQAFREKHGLVDIGGGPVTQQQIAELNQRLVAARAALSEAQARNDQVGRVNGEGTSEALASPVIAALRAQIAEVMRREAELTAQLGDRHPAVVQVRAELASLRSQVAAEIARIKQSAANDLAVAKAAVESLEAELDRLSGRNLKDKAAMTELQELQREADSIRQIHDSLLARLQKASEDEQLLASTARVLAPAATPSGSGFPQPWLVLGFAALLGLGAGSAIAVARDRFDDRIHDASELRNAGLDVFAVVPPVGGGRAKVGFEYAIRLLRAELRDSRERSKERTALFVPINGTDGAAGVALNVALAAVSNGERVLIVDADAANRSLSQMVAPDAHIGLAEVLTGKALLKDALVGDSLDSFQILPIAPREGGYRGRPSRQAFERLIAQARGHFDYTILVGAPLADEPDARAIAEAVEQVAIVLRADRTTKPDVVNAMRVLRIPPEKTCGMVVTQSDVQPPR